MLHVQTNEESYLITAIILYFVCKPVTTTAEIFPLVFAGLIAMASKYVFAFKRKHIFNPAACGVFVIGLLGFGSAIWWVATPYLAPLTAIICFLVVRKIRRSGLFFAFTIFALATISFYSIVINKVALMQVLPETLLSWPLFFFAGIMLTEPLTTPPTKRYQALYGALVGILFGAQFQIGPIYATPELALVLGNIFAYVVSPKERLLVTLAEKKDLASHMYEFIMTVPHKITYLPGQYMEWTLAHARPDSRGNRRYFTLASSPTEKDLLLGVKIEPEKSSSFKKKLASLDKGSIIVASQLSGDFTLPHDASKKLVFIAGGIGITPFRSMIKYLIDTNEKRDIILVYSAALAEEFAYKSIFEEAEQKLSIKTIYLLTTLEKIPPDWKGGKGRITDSFIKEAISDYSERVFYLSGPNAMVESYKILLQSLGVKGQNIKADYFPGF